MLWSAASLLRVLKAFFASLKMPCTDLSSYNCCMMCTAASCPAGILSTFEQIHIHPRHRCGPPGEWLWPQSGEILHTRQWGVFLAFCPRKLDGKLGNVQEPLEHVMMMMMMMIIWKVDFIDNEQQKITQNLHERWQRNKTKKKRH